MPNQEIPRKFVSVVGNGSYVYAVADDGTAWRFDKSMGSQWVRIPDLPPRVGFVDTTNTGSGPR